MGTRPRWGAELQDLPTAVWPTYLTEHSGLPGPRANLELASSVAGLAEKPMIDELLASGDEYHAMCAAAAIGIRADDPSTEVRAREMAADERWRVREGIALGLQLLGDTRPGALIAITRRWVDDPDPLVQRCAVAALCEPRLLRDREAAITALDLCERATQNLAALSADERTSPRARTLRQALGYCWSVAVAADPAHGLDAFRGLEITDPDIAWIVKENSRKKRLSALLEE